LPDVSVVLPTYNEREAIRLLHPRLSAALSGYSAELIVVDDASPDGTGDLVDSLSPPGLYRLIRRPSRQGLSSAVLDGIAASAGRAIVVMDADGSHPPELIPELVRPVLDGTAEFVLASRNVPGGSSPGLVGTRRAISWIAAGLARPLTTVHDPISGFFSLDRSILGRAPLRPVGYKIGLEILVRCRPRPVREIPFCFETRLAGVSKLNGAEVSGYVHHVMRLYAWRISGFGRASNTR
jgi:dolichol-phosphate mannosyltransferase